MQTRHLALVSQTPAIDAAALMRVSAALQKQLARDFGPIWGVNATIDPFASLEAIPDGYWPVVITLADLPNHLLGLHHEENGQPIAYVAWSESWSMTASHECLELLVDPSGNQVRNAPALEDPQQRVDYLLEVCDPCQAVSYSVNGFLVSDFYTPEYFDRAARPGARYSFTGTIERPLQVLDGGYLSWRDALSRQFFQIDGAGQRRNLGELLPGARAWRGQVDERTQDHLRPTKLSRAAISAKSKARHEHARAVATRRAEAVRAHLAQADKNEQAVRLKGETQ